MLGLRAGRGAYGARSTGSRIKNSFPPNKFSSKAAFLSVRNRVSIQYVPQRSTRAKFSGTNKSSAALV